MVRIHANNTVHSEWNMNLLCTKLDKNSCHFVIKDVKIKIIHILNY